MARDVDSLPPPATVRRQVGRTVANIFVVVVSVAVLAAWAYFGFYQIEPGQHAVILRFGLYARTVTEPGLKWHLPPPIESHELVNVGSIEKEQFGFPSTGAAGEEQRLEGTVQTKDNNLAHVGFVVQYKIKNAFFSRYRVANPRDTLRDTAQAALREVIGRTSIDGVLSERRGAVEQETQDLLQKTLDRYETGLLIDGVQLQEVQPPPEVQAAFDDVIGASQDRNRSINEAQGYANEVLPRARAESVELREAAQGFRDAKVAEAQGAATRFTALLDEYRKAPEVTRKRLYLETMEEVLPDVEKVIIEPGTTNVLPYLPLGRAAEGRGGAEPAR
jgi:membrane protease subunit HflK